MSSTARTGGGAEECRCVGLADDERGDGQVEFVCEVLGHELSVDGAAAFDHEASHAEAGEFVQDRSPDERRPGADHVGQVVEPEPTGGRGFGR
jgi:hypothetical protein